MFDIIGLSFSKEWTPVVVALDLIVKATALLAVAFVVHLAVGRRRTLVRSALWNASLIGLLLLPASSLALPGLSISIPGTRQPPPALAATPETRAVPHVSDASFIDKSHFMDEYIQEEQTDSVAPTLAAGLPTAHRLQGAVVPAPRGRRLDVAWLIPGVYVVVLMVLLARFVASLAAVDRLRRRSEPIEHPEWVDALERWRTRLGITRQVKLFTSDYVSVPVVVGWLRPSILLPDRLATLAGRSRMDAVL
ncbi:MAG: M56 family metallopeptidase, partial [Isosphaeraceae bacterium]